MKVKKSIKITNVFQKILKEAHLKPNKMWVDKGSGFFNRSMKSWLEKDNIEMHLTHNEEKSVIAERFIRILKNEIYKYMTSVQKNVFVDKLDDIVNKNNNTYHNTIKTVGVKSKTYIESSKEFDNVINLKLVILLEYQNIKTFLQKVMLQISLKNIFLLEEIKTHCHGRILLVILKEKS